MELEQGDLVLCTVEKIERTIVFVKVPVGNKEVDGSIITSEIAPGRIRNIRDYVVPKKKIVCKVLRITQSGNIELSLRRVTPKEKKEVLEEHNVENSYEKIIRSVLGKKSDEVIKKIRESERLYDFISQGKQDTKKLEKVFGKKESEKILEILSSQKQKKATLKKEIMLFSYEPNGVKLIKNLIGRAKNVNVSYISAGKYSIKSESEDVKSADKKIQEFIEEIKDYAKKNKLVFEIKEK